jgi:hypothetical protein
MIPKTKKTKKMRSFDNFLENHWARKAQIYMKAFLNSTDSILLTSWSRGSGGATIKKAILHAFSIRKNILKSSSPEPAGGPMSIKLGTNHPWVKRTQVCSIKGR